MGSSIQIALFVIPVIELLAWTIGKPMTLLFDRESSSLNQKKKKKAAVETDLIFWLHFHSLRVYRTFLICIDRQPNFGGRTIKVSSL